MDKAMLALGQSTCTQCADGTFDVNIVTVPTIIDGPGQYVARSGEIITITGEAPANGYASGRWWFGRYSCGIPEQWHASGRIWQTQECDNDIIRKV